MIVLQKLSNVSSASISSQWIENLSKRKSVPLSVWKIPPHWRFLENASFSTEKSFAELTKYQALTQRNGFAALMRLEQHRGSVSSRASDARGNIAFSNVMTAVVTAKAFMRKILQLGSLHGLYEPRFR